MKRALGNSTRTWALAVAGVVFLPAAQAEGELCADSPPRFDAVTSPALGATTCNLPQRPVRPTGDADSSLSRAAGDMLQLAFERDGVPADGQSIVVVRVAARDRDGAALTRPLKLTIETSRGRVVSEDNSFTRNTPRFLADRDRREPGVQLELAGGARPAAS